MAGFGWLSQMCENMSFDHITFKGDGDHIVSSFADLIQTAIFHTHTMTASMFTAHL